MPTQAFDGALGEFSAEVEGFEWGRASLRWWSWSRGGYEVSQGEEGSPEAPFGPFVVEGGVEGWQTEPCRAFRPGEPRAHLGFGEGALGERVV